MANHEQIMINEPASNLATKYLDTYGVTVGSTLLLREYTVIGGSTPSALADVITTDPTSNAPGVVVRDVNTSAVVSRLGSTIFVQLDPGHTLGSISTLGSITSTVGVYLDATQGTLRVKLDPSSVVQISNIPAITGTVTANVGTGTMAVYFDQSNPSVKANAGTGSFNVQFDPGHTLGKVDAGLGTFNVQLDPGHQIGNIGTLASITNTVNVQLDPGHTIGNIGSIGSITGSVAVYFDRANPAVSATFSAASIEVIPTTGSRKITDDAHAAQRVLIVGSQTAASLTINGTVTSNAGTGTLTVAFDPGHELGTIKGNSNTLTVFLPDTGHTLGKVDAGLGTFNVQLDPGHTLGSISSLGSITNTVAVFFSPANPAVSATFSAASIEVIPTTGSRKITDDAAAAMRVLVVGSQTNASLTINGTLTGITNSVAVHVLSTNGTMAVNVGKVDGTVTVRLDPGNTLGTVNQGVASATQAWLVNQSSTFSIFTVSGSTSGVSASGVQLVAPSASYNFKVYAFSLQTTGIVSTVARFTNGAGSATELWRGLVTSNQTASAPIGANLAVQPPGYLFATGTNVTLALHLDTATLVHYSVSYIKESA